jgi:kumamolisin
VKALTEAFKVEVHKYEKEDRSYRGRVGSISVPADLAGIVVGVHGFDNRPVASPHYRRPEKPAETESVGAQNAPDSSLSPLEIANLYFSRRVWMEPVNVSP